MKVHIECIGGKSSNSRRMDLDSLAIVKFEGIHFVYKLNLTKMNPSNFRKNFVIQ